MASETHAAYQVMFNRVFSLVEQVTGQPLRWQHLHKAGFQAVVMDMGGAQLKGE